MTSAESIAALTGATLEGEWTGIFQFHVVDIGPMRKDTSKALAGYVALHTLFMLCV